MKVCLFQNSGNFLSPGGENYFVNKAINTTEIYYDRTYALGDLAPTFTAIAKICI